MIYNIAVIEDCTTDFELLKANLEQFFHSKKALFHLTHFTNAVSFLEEYQLQFHLIFMDIELPGLNGMDAARRLREKDTSTSLVFLTNLAHYAINGYEVDAIDYILKPIDKFSFFLKMPKVIQHIALNSVARITINTKNSIRAFFVSEIFFIEIVSHQLIYHTKRGNFETRGTMQMAEAKLANYQFCRCNNCYLVNLAAVSSIEGNNVLIGSDVLAISRPKKKNFINELTNYLGGTL